MLFRLESAGTSSASLIRWRTNVRNLVPDAIRLRRAIAYQCGTVAHTIRTPIPQALGVRRRTRSRVVSSAMNFTARGITRLRPRARFGAVISQWYLSYSNFVFISCSAMVRY